MSFHQPTTIDELIENALAELGAGVIDINVSEVQCVKAAQKAIQMFADYHYDATELVYVTQDITQNDLDNGYVSTPDNVWNVIRVLGIHKLRGRLNALSDNRLYNDNNYYSSSDNFGSSNVILGQNQGIVDRSKAITSYWFAETNRSFFNSLIFPNIGMDWNRGSRRIRFRGRMHDTITCDSTVVYEARVLNEDIDFACDQPASNGSSFYNNEWLKEYTAAQIQKMWGNNLSKFSDMHLTAGLQFNGRQILDDARTNIERLEEQLFNNYSPPPMMIIG